MIGDTVSKYRILEKIGEGGMGTVYKAKDISLDRIVALKMLPSHTIGNYAAKARFLREAKVSAQLNHTNIAHIYEVDETSRGQPFIAMEYVEGETLAKLIEKGPLSITRAIDIMVQATEALNAAHETGILHRDIKSTNIMITSGGQVKIMDFGLAQIIGASKITIEGQMLGTIPYMSPEQARAEQIDQRSDIWSLGVVFYEMITGQLPFKGEYNEVIVYSIINEDPKPLTAVRSGIPIALDSIIAKALAKNKEHRYQHVDEFGADLKSYHFSSMGKSGFNRQLYKLKYLFFGLLVLAVAFMIFKPTYLLDAFSENNPPPTEDQPASVAVLPFKDFSEKGNQQWFSDGLTEEIIISLSKIPELDVKVGTSSSIFRNSTLSIRSIADSLNVEHIVDGSVRRSENQMRVSVQLIRASDSKNLWSEIYDKKVDSVFKVQEDIAVEIASALDVYLDDEKRNLMFAYGTSNVKAYEAYLKGVTTWAQAHNPVNPAMLWEANKWLEKAYQFDPNFAAPYYFHHDAYAHYLFEGRDIIETLDPGEVYNLLHDDLDKAIELTDNEGERLLYQFDKTYFSGDWTKIPKLVEQIRNSKKAKEFFSISYGGGWIITVLPAMGYANLALQLTTEALKKDPLNNQLIASRANAFAALGKIEQAVELLDEDFLEVMLLAEIGKRAKADSLLKLKINTSPDSSINWLYRTSSVTRNEIQYGSPGIDGEDVSNLLYAYFSNENDDASNFISIEGTPNQIARNIDSNIHLLGPQKLLLFIVNNASILTFDLKSTPNLSERFNEAGIKVEPHIFLGQDVYRIVQKE